MIGVLYITQLMVNYIWAILEEDRQHLSVLVMDITFTHTSKVMGTDSDALTLILAHVTIHILLH